MKKETQTRANKVQNLAKNFFTKRDEKSFQLFYQILNPIVLNTSFSVLKNTELAEDVTSEVFTKIYFNKTYVFDETKSYLSYLMRTATNASIIVYNNLRKTSKNEVLESVVSEEFATNNSNSKFIVSESEFANYDEESSNGVLDFFNKGEGGEIETFNLLHNCSEIQLKRIEEIIEEIHTDKKDEETRLRDIQIIKQSLLENVGPTELQSIYNFESRVTLTSRRRRALEKIVEILIAEINYCKLLDGGQNITGEFRSNYTDNKKKFCGSLLDGKLDGKCTKYSEGDSVVIWECDYKNSKRNGSYKEFYRNGNLKVQGEYINGEKTGFWFRYFYNGNLEEKVDYSSENRNYYVFSQDGEIEEFGEHFSKSLASKF